jgi:mannose-1-phosphate guanylyltransferase
VRFFILAGGYGKRAEPLSLLKPKTLFPLNGMPLLSLLLKQLRTQGCRQGFINLHHLGEQIAEFAAHDSNIAFVHEKELSGSLVLRQALPHFSDWLLVINGDTFLEIPLARMLEKTADPAVDGVLLVRTDSSVQYARLAGVGDEFHGVCGKAAGPGLMYAGAALFKKKMVEKISTRNFFDSIKNERLQVRMVLYDDVWLDFGTPASYFRANWLYKVHVGDARPTALSADVEISPRAWVEKTVLWENTRIGADVSLAECIVTGNISLENISLRQRIVSSNGIFPLF